MSEFADLYEVQLTEIAEANIEEIFDWLFGFTVVGAFRFRDRIAEEIASLNTNPLRCRLAEENEMYDRDVRLHQCRSGNSTYRILFSVYEPGELFDDSPATVSVLRIRHGASRPLWESNGGEE